MSMNNFVRTYPAIYFEKFFLIEKESEFKFYYINTEKEEV